MLLLGVAFLVVGVVLLVGRLAGYAGFVDALRSAEPWWLVLCPAGELVAYAGYVLVFRSIAGEPRLPYWLATRIVLAAEGATRMLSPAGAGGIGVFYWILRRRGAGRHDAAVRVLTLNVLVFGLFALVAWGAAVALLLGAGEAPLALTAGWIAAVAGAVLAAAAVVVLARRCHGRLSRIAPVRFRRLRRAGADVVAALAAAASIVSRPAAHRAVYAGSVLYWVGDVLCLWAGLRAFGVEVGLAALLVAFATGYVAVALPLPTAGIGGVDAAMTLALVWVGVPLAPALLGVFAYRFFNFLVPTLPGLAALSTLPLLGREAAAVSGRKPAGAAAR